VDGLENQVDGPGLTVGPEDRGLLVALGHQDLLLPDPFGGKDFGLPFAFGVQDGCALVPLGSHLLLHRLLDGERGSNALISTRFTRIPHLPVASSSTMRRRVLISSREVRVCSRSMLPMTLRNVVTVSWSMACR